MSPLYVASGNGHLNVVRALLSAGAEVDGQDHSGHSPLYTACQGGHAVVAHALLSTCSVRMGPRPCT